MSMVNKISGIYIIINTINGKIYIGSSKDINGRWNSHKRLLKNNKHINIHLQKSWNKYGENAFEFDVIMICNVENLKEIEQKYLDYIFSFDEKTRMENFYNIGKDSECWNRGSKGLHNHSNETKLKMSLSHRGKTKSKEHVQKVAEGSRDQSIYTIKNLISNEIFRGKRCEFYTKYNLKRTKVYELISGNYKQHKGWMVLNKENNI